MQFWGPLSCVTDAIKIQMSKKLISVHIEIKYTHFIKNTIM